MDRNRHTSVSNTLPSITTSGNTVGFFTKGNPGLGIAATIPTADWANGVTEEIRNAIISAGLTPSQTDLTQLTQTINLRAPKASPTLTGAVNINCSTLGFYGSSPVAKPAAQTATVIAAPAGGTGVAAGAWSSANDRNTAIALINNLKTRLDSLETKLQTLGLLS